MIKKFIGAFILLVITFLLLVVVDVVRAGSLGKSYILGFILHELPFMGDEFTIEEWQTARSCEGLTYEECLKNEDNCTRGGMIRSLTKEYLSTDTADRKLVTEILGPPEYDLLIQEDNCFGYTLGMCSGFRLDYDSLYVCFDDSGHVSATGHVQH